MRGRWRSAGFAKRLLQLNATNAQLRSRSVMPPSHDHGPWPREELLHLLTLAGTLAGLCITGVTLFHTMGKSTLSGTIADNTLAISALLFLLSTYTIFFTLRTRKLGLAALLTKIADVLFLAALTGMVASGFIMVYTVW